MYHEMKALLEAKTRAGEDGQDIVEGALRAIHEFVTTCANIPLEAEFRRLAAILTGPYKGMDMLGAFDDTLEFFRTQLVTNSFQGAGSLKHLEDMRSRITDDFSPAKLRRWLGWAQAVTFLSTKSTLDDFKKINERRSRPTPSPLPVTHFVFRSRLSRAVFVKEAEFFIQQGGMTDLWGKRWMPVIAEDIEHARRIGEQAYPMDRGSEDLRPRSPAMMPIMPERFKEEVAIATGEPETMTIVRGRPSYLKGGQYYTPELIKDAIEALQRELPHPEKPVGWPDTADATKWADAFITVTRAPTFEVPNLWDHNFLTGWFANAIEAGRRHHAKPIADLLKAGSDWCLEMIFDARAAHEDGTPRMGKFETEQVFRAFKAALNDRFRP